MFKENDATKKTAIYYTGLFLVMTALIYGYFVKEQKSFIWEGDGFSQHYLVFKDYLSMWRGFLSHPTARLPFLGLEHRLGGGCHRLLRLLCDRGSVRLSRPAVSGRHDGIGLSCVDPGACVCGRLGFLGFLQADEDKKSGSLGRKHPLHLHFLRGFERGQTSFLSPADDHFSFAVSGDGADSAG